jgi:hypothetical protein
MSDGWTNKKLQADPEGYLRWQAEQKGKAERERKEAQEKSDFEQFKRIFVERGGDPSKSREMYERYRNDMALEEAKKHDRATSERMRSVRSKAV